MDLKGNVTEKAYLRGYVAEHSLPAGSFTLDSRSITISADSWYLRANDVICEIAFAGMTEDAIVLCSVVPRLAMEKEVAECVVRCVAQEHNNLVFAALGGKAPTIDIDMNILVMG